MFQFFLIIGIVCIIISGIFVGAWVDGDRQRANFHTETSDGRSFRTKVALIFALIGIVAFIIAGMVYLIVGI